MGGEEENPEADLLRSVGSHTGLDPRDPSLEPELKPGANHFTN